MRASAAVADSPSGGTVYTACGPKPTWRRPSRPSRSSKTRQASARKSCHGLSGRSKTAVVKTARIPESTTASVTGSGCRYCSQLVVIPLVSISTAPSAMPQ